METEKDINSKILNITMKIRNQYTELSKYLEEMNETIPDKMNPEITVENLKLYYESLRSMLDKYILEHPSNNKIISSTNYSHCKTIKNEYAGT